MIETSTSIKALSAALFKFQGLVHGVVKDARNPHFKNTYASLEAVIDTARPGLQQVGLVFTQAPGKMRDGLMEVVTFIVHPESGEWMRATMDIPVSKNDPQSAGSALTYALRYSLMATLGLPPVDDDGETARSNAGTVPAAVASGKAAQPVATDLIKSIRRSQTAKALQEWINSPETTAALNRLNEPDYQSVKDEYTKMKKALLTAETITA